MRVAVTGASGQLGSDVMSVLSDAHDVIGLARNEMDLARPSSIESVLTKVKPDLIVHCGAYTMVDKAEEERDLCHRINVDAAREIAGWAGRNGSRMIHMSTDYVFDGTKPEPYEVDDPTNPINFYGRTKLEAELAVKEEMEGYQIIRTSWVFGARGKNFVRMMLGLGRQRSTVSVVDDQVGSPTYSVDLAKLILEMTASERFGVYHATNEGYVSWHQFAVEIFKRRGLEVIVKPITSKEFRTKALRPKNSRLSKRSLDESGFHRLPSWQSALDRFLLEIKEDEG